MNRRDVLKAFSSLALAPLIRLDLTHERDLSALVNEFCDTDGNSRYCLTDPWEYSGESIATDSSVMISVPGLRYVATGDKKRRPDAGSVFRSFWPIKDDGRKWHRMPLIRRRKNQYVDYCPECSRRHPCAWCDGDGEDWDRPTLLTVKCARCNGIGYIPDRACDICHGQRSDIAWNEEFGDQLLNARYARMIRQIPGAMWMPGAEARQSAIDYRGPIIIRGDGGIRAFVMPVYPEAVK